MTNRFEIDFLEDYSQPSLLEELRRVQKIVGGRPVTKADIDKYSKAGWTTYFRKFGSFSKALAAAGLDTSRRVNVSREELINAVVRLWTLTIQKEGRRPFCSDLEKYKIPYSEDTYRRRFGSWKKALIVTYNSVGTKENIIHDAAFNKVTQEPSRRSREEISIRRRFLVFKRDHFTCIFCGKSGVGIKLEIDHKTPLSKGGGNDVNNLQTLCFECNRGKRNDLE
jgi:5-methylcytosine-specific restriction endonuclease McrA